MGTSCSQLAVCQLQWFMILLDAATIYPVAFSDSSSTVSPVTGLMNSFFINRS